MKNVSILLIGLVCCSCSVLPTLTGNSGELSLVCSEKDEVVEGQVLKGSKIEVTLPAGSGRVFPQGIDAKDSPCGIAIPAIQQGEDRSGGILGFLSLLIGL